MTLQLKYQFKNEEIMTPNKNLNRVMESKTISKNEASPKNQRSKINIKIVNFTLLCFFCINSFLSYGAYLSNVPITITQPDGTKIECFVTGDEYYNWAHDKDGYTIIQDKNTGYYCYAVLNRDELTASQYVVGKTMPKSGSLTPNINISGEKILEKRNEFIQKIPQTAVSKNSGTPLRAATGTVNNIVVYIRFADQTEFPAKQGSTYTPVFNSTSSGHSSMRNYFQEVSYNQLDILTHFYPTNNGTIILSYQDAHNRDYYCPYNAVTNPNGYTSQATREHTLLANAINYVASQIPSSLNLDYNNDGRVDNVCFIVRGGVTDWNTLLWPHRWSLYSQTVNINGKRVYDYNLLLENHSDVSVLCHEMNHTFGAPDLYHNPNNDSNTPVGVWDIMAVSSLNPPQHMGAYMKHKYGGWIPFIPSITTSGTYTLQPLTSASNNCYKIPIQGSSQYFVAEYRKKTGTFENSLPSSGLIIYRVNENYSGNFNGVGTGGVSDEVYIFRRNGTISVNGDIYNAHFSGTSGRTRFSDITNPHGFSSDGSYTNICIKNIQENPNGTLSFEVRFCNDYITTHSNTSNLPDTTTTCGSIYTSGTVTVKSTDNIVFEAGNEVILDAGFEIKSGGTFEIRMNTDIINCCED